MYFCFHTVVRDCGAGPWRGTVVRDCGAGLWCGTMAWDRGAGLWCGTMAWDHGVGPWCGTVVRDGPNLRLASLLQRTYVESVLWGSSLAAEIDLTWHDSKPWLDSRGLWLITQCSETAWKQYAKLTGSFESIRSNFTITNSYIWSNLKTIALSMLILCP